jgi:hypothetical protein
MEKLYCPLHGVLLETILDTSIPDNQKRCSECEKEYSPSILWEIGCEPNAFSFKRIGRSVFSVIIHDCNDKFANEVMNGLEPKNFVEHITNIYIYAGGKDLTPYVFGCYSETEVENNSCSMFYLDSLVPVFISAYYFYGTGQCNFVLSTSSPLSKQKLLKELEKLFPSKLIEIFS